MIWRMLYKTLRLVNTSYSFNGKLLSVTLVIIGSMTGHVCLCAGPGFVLVKIAHSK